MDRETLLAILNEALTLQLRSFPRYVLEVSLPRSEGAAGPEFLDLLREIVGDEDRTAGRILELLEDLGAPPEVGTYGFGIGPYNYLRAGYLAAAVGERHRRDVQRLGELRARAEGEAAAEAILADALGREERHLEGLDRLAAPGPSLGRPEGGS